jgi:hypothetical protein
MLAGWWRWKDATQLFIRRVADVGLHSYACVKLKLKLKL